MISCLHINSTSFYHISYFLTYVIFFSGIDKKHIIGNITFIWRETVMNDVKCPVCSETNVSLLEKKENIIMIDKVEIIGYQKRKSS